MQFLEGGRSAITTLAFAPDGERLAVGNRDGTVSIAAFELRPLGELAGTPVQALTFDPSGDKLFCAGKTGWYAIDPVAEERWNVHVPIGSASTTSLVFLNDAVLAIGSGDRTQTEPGLLELRNMKTGRRLEPHFREPTGVRAVTVHEPSRCVAWANAQNRVSIWNTLTLEPQALPLPHPAPALAFQPDGDGIAIAQEWGIVVFDPLSRVERRTLKGHTGRVTAVAYSPDGRRIATASWDRTVRLWDAAGGDNLSTFDWGIGRVYCLAFSPDGLRLAAGGESGTVAICDVE